MGSFRDRRLAKPSRRQGSRRRIDGFYTLRRFVLASAVDPSPWTLFGSPLLIFLLPFPSFPLKHLHASYYARLIARFASWMLMQSTSRCVLYYSRTWSMHFTYIGRALLSHVDQIDRREAWNKINSSILNSNAHFYRLSRWVLQDLISVKTHMLSRRQVLHPHPVILITQILVLSSLFEISRMN